MSKIYIILLFICSSFQFISAEEVEELKQVSIKFDRLEADTLDSYVAKNGKNKLLNLFDTTISKLNFLIKNSTQNIKEVGVAFQLKALNKHFSLNMDSFLLFNPSLNVDSGMNRVYGILLGNTKQGIEFITEAKKNNFDFNKIFINEVFNSDVRNGLYIFCNYLEDVKQSSLDTLYKAALIYPNEIRNEFYYALIEFDRNCGNATNNSKYYKDLLYSKMKDAMSLERALKDTSTINTLNYTQYLLTPKYQFLAYSLYAKNFDIKANQKEIIYFLSSQNKVDGGFKEFSIEQTDKPVKSKVEPTFYALWALLELREQINALYPDDIVKPIPTPTNSTPKKK